MPATTATAADAVAHLRAVLSHDGVVTREFHDDVLACIQTLEMTLPLNFTQSSNLLGYALRKSTFDAATTLRLIDDLVWYAPRVPAYRDFLNEWRVVVKTRVDAENAGKLYIDEKACIPVGRYDFVMLPLIGDRNPAAVAYAE
jgi:hypothetical protein